MPDDTQKVQRNVQASRMTAGDGYGSQAFADIVFNHDVREVQSRRYAKKNMPINNIINNLKPLGRDTIPCVSGFTPKTRKPTAGQLETGRKGEMEKR
jgi:hypothetical protein